MEAISKGDHLDSILVPFGIHNGFGLPQLPCHKIFHRNKREVSTTNADDSIGIQKLNALLDPNDKVAKQEKIEKEKQKYNFNFGSMDIKKSYKSLFEVLWYSQLPCYDIKDITSSTKDQMSVIKRCFWKGKDVNCSSIFQKRPTDRGMCCSFNAREADKIFRNTIYGNMVSSMQNQDALYSIDDTSLPDGYNSKSQAGQQKGLQLVLDAHADKVSSGTIPEDYRGFISIVDGNENYPLTQRKGILVRPGRMNNVAMSAYQVIADENVRLVDPIKRNCYFNNENPLDMHQNYTYTNCILECAIDVVRNDMLDETGQTCTPWFYPSIDEYATDICDPWKNKKFLKLVAEVPSEKCSHCLSDCEVTNYEARISTAFLRMCDHTNIGSSSMCNMQDITMNPPMWSNLVTNEYKVAKGDVPEFARPSPKRLSNIRPYVQRPGQKETLAFKNAHDTIPTYDAFEKDIGVINVFFKEKKIIKYVTENRMSFFDFLSQIGGSLGLVMGISIISLCEIIYWFTFRLLANLGKTYLPSFHRPLKTS